MTNENNQTTFLYKNFNSNITDDGLEYFNSVDKLKTYRKINQISTILVSLIGLIGHSLTIIV
jgi:hypothetical protein